MTTLMQGTHGSFKSITQHDGSFIMVRIIDQAEINQKTALVSIKHHDGSIENRLDDIPADMWDHIKKNGIEAAKKDNVDITREPFNQYIAREYHNIIR